MAVEASEARLRFLRQAAHQLFICAPIVSAALSSQYVQSAIGIDEDLQHATKEWDMLRREACGACGSILLPGWSNSVSRSSSRTRFRTRAQKQQLSTPLACSNKTMVSTCLRCDRRSAQALQSRPPKHMSSGSIRAKPLETDGAMVKEQAKATKSVNATSKQRKKSRKGGLQAMLEKNKSQSAARSGPGLGLDLMDFMQ